jgi:hypothetical protein
LEKCILDQVFIPYDQKRNGQNTLEVVKSGLGMPI